MFGLRHGRLKDADVRFCDGCGEVTTAMQRAARQRETEWMRAAARYGR